MTYPDIIRAQLDQAIDIALQNSTFAPVRPSRMRKVTHKDIIKALIFMEGGSLKKELYAANLHITSSAFTQRRHQILSMLFEDILTTFNGLHSGHKTYQGYRIAAIDGTTVNMARNPKSNCFVLHPGAPKGYCQMHANPLYDVLNKTYYDSSGNLMIELLADLKFFGSGFRKSILSRGNLIKRELPIQIKTGSSLFVVMFSKF